MKNVLLITALTLFSNLAFASGGSGIVSIKNIHQRECSGDRDFEIALSSPHSNPDSCRNNSTVNLSCNHVALPQMTSLAIAAMVSEKKVFFWLSGCDAEGQAKVSTIQVIK